MPPLLKSNPPFIILSKLFLPFLPYDLPLEFHAFYSLMYFTCHGSEPRRGAPVLSGVCPHMVRFCSFS